MRALGKTSKAWRVSSCCRSCGKCRCRVGTVLSSDRIELFNSSVLIYRAGTRETHNKLEKNRLANSRDFQ